MYQRVSGRVAIAALLTLALPADLIAQGDIEAGRLFYNRTCGGCHALTPEVNVYAPNLHCVIGRGAGSAPFPAYTDDMKALAATGLVWTEETLAVFLTDPAAFVAAQLRKADPVILMQVRVEEESNRRDVIAYMVSRCG